MVTFMFNNFAWKRAFNFNDKEASLVIIISLLSGFILSFRMWGTDRFDASVGLSNLFLYSILFMFLFFIFLASQKFIAATMGLDARVSVWKYGPPIGVLVTLMSYGLIPFIFMGGVSLKEIPRLRVGKFMGTAVNIKEMLFVGLFGPLVLILLSLLVFFPLYLLSGISVFYDLVWVSSLILVVTALPLPSLNGLNLLLKYRAVWVLYLLYTLFLFILLSFLKNPWVYALALILSLFFGWLVKKGIHDSKYF